MNVIFGASGFAKEVEWLIFETENISIDYFVIKDQNNASLNDIPIVSEDDFLQIDSQRSANIYIGIGSPIIRKSITDRLLQLGYSDVNFKNVIHPNVSYDKRRNRLRLGLGNLICSNNVLTTDISIGNHVHINLDCTIGHDSNIGSFVTLSPGVHISGNVTIGDESFIGTGAVILEGLKISEKVIIGAGALVNKDIVESGTYVGVPAKRIK